MSVIWKKVWRDIWHHKARTAQVVLSIAVGVFAVGFTVGMRDLVKSEVDGWVQAGTPSQIVLGVGEGVDREVIQALGRLPGMEGAEGLSSVDIRWKVRPEDEWHDATLIARNDYPAQQYDKVILQEGSWPGRGGVAVEQGSVRHLNIPYPGTVYLEVNERARVMQVVGVTFDSSIDPSPLFSGEANLYVTRREMEKLGGPTGFTQIKAALPEYDEERARAAGVAMTERLEELGIGHGTPFIIDPDAYFDAGNGIFGLLIVMAVLSMGLSLFLVVNTITAIIAEQVPQIGVMKATGAVSWQIFRVYLSGVMVYILLALLIAIPLGAIGAELATDWLLGLFAKEVRGFAVSTTAVSLQLGLGLLAPLLAALWPVRAGARITVREAISTYGLGVAAGLVDRLLARLRRLPPLVALTVSNTFRRKGRLIMTQVSLVGGGAIFMMVMSVQASMVNTFDIFLDTYNFDVWIDFEHPQRIRTIEAQVESFPGVKYAEAIQLHSAGVRRVDDEDGTGEEHITLVGVAPGGNAYHQVLTGGRWLLPDDDHTIVLNQNLAQELGVSVGEEVTIELAGEETTWTVVGTLFDIMNNQTGSAVWLDTLSGELGTRGQASALYVGATHQDEASLVALARDLRAWLDAANKNVTTSLTAPEFRSQQLSSLMIIVYLLAVVAVLIAAVGSIALAGTLGINALERRREIGVMRAIGASGRAVGGLFVGEGLIIGLMSWALAVPLSFPLALLFTNFIGSAIELQLIFRYSPMGVVLWLVVVAVLSVLASGLPAWRATRVRVREVLAYE